MTKTYLIHAWCVRPFIAYLDEVEAATAAEAIAIARRKPEKLLDAAEECNGQYPWNESAAYDDSGNELLHILDAEARLREAAPALLDALLTIRAALQLHLHLQDSMAGQLLMIADKAIAAATLA